MGRHKVYSEGLIDLIDEVQVNIKQECGKAEGEERLDG